MIIGKNNFFPLLFRRTDYIRGTSFLSVVIQSRKSLTGDTIPSFVFSQIDIAILLDLLKDFFYAAAMPILGCPNEIIVRDVEVVPQGFEFIYHAINKFYGRFIAGFGAAFWIFCPCSSVPVRKNTSRFFALLYRASASAAMVVYEWPMCGMSLHSKWVL